MGLRPEALGPTSEFLPISEAGRGVPVFCRWVAQAGGIVAMDAMASRVRFRVLRVDGGPQQRLLRWQSVRTWARLIREAEGLWRVDVRDLRRLAAHELGQLLQEVPPRLRRRVNRWLERLKVSTRLG